MSHSHGTTEHLPQRLSVGSHGVQSTIVDRRGAVRKVPMKVLCLGLGRSGTNSLRHALLDLGYSDVCHYSSLYENPKDAELWVEALQAKYEGQGKPYGRKEWDALLGHCMAVTDTPCVVFYKELLEAYPEAKVVLTLRDSPEDWHASFLHTIQPFLDWQHGYRPGMYEFFYRYFLPKTPFWHMNEILRHHFIFADIHHMGPISYQGYNEEIQRIVPKNKLLVYRVKDGWEPLCEFLGEQVPKHSFPQTNEREVLKRNIDTMKAITDADIHKKMWRMAGIVSAVAAGCAGILYTRLLRVE